MTTKNIKQGTDTGFTTRVLMGMREELVDALAAVSAVVVQYDALAKVHGLRSVAGTAPLL
jgi:hypothetical protein